MASIVETKAVALRRGNHSENMAFTGVQGETVVDLGYEDLNGNLGTDSNTTLRLHNGITKGGIPMARADLLNVSSEMLAENRQQINDRNLAYADLSNLERTDAPSVQNKIKTTMMVYGLAEEESVQTRLDGKVNLNTDNLNTSYLVSTEIHDGLEGNKPLAYADTTNINTADLANGDYHNGTPEGNKPLAYEDTSNINTADLANSSIHNGEMLGNDPLAYANSSNVDTTNMTLNTNSRPNTMSGPVLARADLANVDNDIIDHIVDTIVDIDTIERTYNKDSVINEVNAVNGHYPETKAVIQYIDSKTESNANVYLTNILDWERLYTTSKLPVMKQTVDVVNSQTGFELQKSYNTGIYLVNDSKESLLVEVSQIDASGTILALELYGNVGSIDLTTYNPFVITSETDVNATFTITSTLNSDNTYTYQINSITDGGSGFEEGGWYFVKSSVSNEYFEIIYKQLEIIPTALINTTNQEGSIGEISKAKCYPEYNLTNIEQSSVTITSDTNTTATVDIHSYVYNNTPGAGLTKVDLTNLTGMTASDQVAEEDANWRIRHDEAIPSLSETTIPSNQDYTIATNGNVWRALKTIQGSIFDVVFFALFAPNTSYSTNPAHLHLTTNVFSVDFDINPYAGGSEQDNTWYELSSNKHYNLQILHGQLSDDYELEWSNSSFMSLGYFIADITFNTNIQNATLKIIRQRDNVIRTFPITNGTVTCLITADSNYEISATGYSSVYGSLDAADGNQTINVTLDEESESI